MRVYTYIHAYSHAGTPYHPLLLSRKNTCLSCMYVCIYVSIYAFMYACMYIRRYTFVCVRRMHQKMLFLSKTAVQIIQTDLVPIAIVRNGMTESGSDPHEVVQTGLVFDGMIRLFKVLVTHKHVLYVYIYIYIYICTHSYIHAYVHTCIKKGSTATDMNTKNAAT